VVSDRFEADNAVCPLNLKCDLFTTAAVDNIDQLQLIVANEQQRISF